MILTLIFFVSLRKLLLTILLILFLFLTIQRSQNFRDRDRERERDRDRDRERERDRDRDRDREYEMETGGRKEGGSWKKQDKSNNNDTTGTENVTNPEKKEVTEVEMDKGTQPMSETANIVDNAVEGDKVPSDGDNDYGATAVADAATLEPEVQAKAEPEPAAEDADKKVDEEMAEPATASVDDQNDTKDADLDDSQEFPRISVEEAQAMKVTDLRAELSKRGLSTKGTKPILVDRLTEA